MTETMQIVKVDPSEFGIEEQTAMNLTAGLKPILDERKLLIEKFETVKDLPMTEENVSIFKELRLKFRDNRTKGINKWHETTKQVPLRMGQLIDAIKRAENATNETHEEILERGEKHFENLEKERIENLRAERWAALQPYMEFEPQGLGQMEESIFNHFLSGAKSAHEAKIEAEKKAEAERLQREKKEAEEREKQRLENIRLKSEAEAREKAIAEERRIQSEKEAKERSEREKERAEMEAKLKAEAGAREKAESKIREQKYAEEKALKQAEAEAKKAAKAPVKTKMKNAVNSLEMPILEGLTGDEYAIWVQITTKHQSFQQWAIAQIETL